MRSLFGRGGATRDVALLAAATAFGQVVALAASPLLTRMYSPSDFGAFAVYFSIVSLASTIVCLRFDFAIPLPEDERDADSLLILALMAAAGVTAVIAIGLHFFGARLCAATHAPRLVPLLWMVPLGVASAGAYQALSYAAVRHRAFKLTAATRFVQLGGQAGGQIALGKVTPGPSGLILGDALGRAVGSLMLAWTIVAGRPLRDQTWKSLRSVAARYRDFPLVATLSGFINGAGLYLPALLVANAFGSDAAGQYTLALRMGAIPAALIGQAVAQVFLGEAARVLRMGGADLDSLYRRSATGLAALAGPAFLILALVSPVASQKIFGAPWREAGVYVRILAPMLAVQFVVSPISVILNVLERQGIQLAWDVGRLVLVLGSLGIARVFGLSARVGLASYAIAMTVAYLILLFITLSLLRSRTPRLEADGKA